jgi:hypothetical protein
MSAQQLDEERVFHLARGIAEPELRAEYLDQVCASDQSLRERVEALLEIYEEEQGFLKSAENPVAPTVELGTAVEKIGGPDRVLQTASGNRRGGFGVVYMGACSGQ